MHSDVIKKGIPAAPNRSLLYALGYTKEELERPLIGVVCSYNEIVPGHMNLDKIAEAVKAGVRAAAIRRPGTFLSQLGIITRPSNWWARAMASVESAMRSRVTREYFMPT